MGGWKYTCFQVSNCLRSRTLNIHNKPRIKGTLVQFGLVGLAARWTILSRLLSLIRPLQRLLSPRLGCRRLFVQTFLGVWRHQDYFTAPV